MKYLNKLIILLSLILLIGVNNIDAQCSASFTYINTGISVLCQSTSSGNNSPNYLWDFGDGSTSTTQNPNHVYANNGFYDVCLIVSDTNNCSDTICETVAITLSIGHCHINGSNFTYTDNGNANISFNPPTYGFTPYSYSWEFGDGNTSNSLTPNHTYQSNGTYNVWLNVVDSNLCHDSLHTQITISNSCNYTVNAYDTIGTQVDFFINAPNATILWDFGDGTSITDSSGQFWGSAIHEYPSAGTYYYCITVDSCPPICDSIVVTGTPCNVISNFTYFDNGSGNYSFTNTSSTSATSFYWDFGDGNASTLENPNHIYSNNGNYTVCLYASDIQGCSNQYCDTITINSVPCSTTAGIDSEADQCFNGNSFSFNNNGASGAQYSWSFGDSLSSSSNLENPTISYLYSGTFTITQIVTSGGCSDTATINVTVLPNPVANFTYVDNGIGNYSFTSNVTGGAAPYTYLWNFGGVGSSLANPSHTFTSGQHNPTLSVTDSNGCSAWDSDTIYVQNCNYLPTTWASINSDTIQFIANTAGTSYFWDLGDGNTSTLQNPFHIYTSSGTYYYCLTVDSCPPVCDSIVVNNPCEALQNGFSYTSNGPGSYIFNMDTSVTNNLSNDPSAYPFITFGDGTSSSSTQSLHTYSSNGTYTVCLSGGYCPTPYCETIVVSSILPCNVNAGFTYVDNGNGNYSFTSNVTGGAAPYTYLWNFGGVSSSLANPSHTFTSGQHNPTLSVTDSNGCSAWDSDTIYVQNCNYLPTTWASINSDTIQFIANTAGTSYFWDLGDGNTSTLQNPFHIYTSSGTYYYCLTVDSCPPVCDSIVVSNPCNVMSNFIYVDNGNGNYSFTNTSTGNIASFYWSFGDGAISNLSNPNHTFVSNGTYITQLIVTDSNGFCSDVKNKTIQVAGVTSPVTCNAAFVITPDSANFGNVIVYNTSTGNNLSYFWNFGDGTSSTQQFPNHTYNGSGPFNLCLTVTDSLNGGTCTSSHCDSINSGGLVFKGGGFTISVVPPTITSVNNAPDLVQELNIYPNPFKNSLTIELNLLESTPTEIFVTDILGNKVAQISNEVLNVGTNKLNWNAAEFSNGIYLLNIKTNSSLQVKKLILNR